MHQHLIAAACKTGTAWQQNVCAHPGDSKVGFETGQAMGPVLIGLVILFVLYLAMRAGSRKAATSS